MNNKDKEQEVLENLLIQYNEEDGDEELLYEMANVDPQDSGLPSELQSLAKGKTRVAHGPRVKVYTPNFGFIPIALGDKVELPNSMKHKDFQKEDMKNIKAAIKYIEQNKELFLKHWNGEITDKELLNTLPHI